MPKKETGKENTGSFPPTTAKPKAKPLVSIEAFQALSTRFDDLEERFNRLVKSHRFLF